MSIEIKNVSIEIKNAVIERASMMINERGILDCMIEFNYGGFRQGFGGYALYLPKSFRHHRLESVAGHFLFRVMEVAGVEKWEQLKGRTVRVKCEWTKVHAVGHIIDDDWFSPSEDFADLRKGGAE